MNRHFLEYTHEAVFTQLEELSKKMILTETKFSPEIERLHSNYHISAANLIHYLVLRSQEIRQIQEYLHQIGLSSLTSCESHTLYQIQRVLHWLNPAFNQPYEVQCTFDTSAKLRARFAEDLLGERPANGRPQIMVTLAGEMASNRILMEEMLEAGMSVARINCAHDSQEVWLTMIDTLKKSVARTGRQCKVYMDLAGPKIRINRIIRDNEEYTTIPIAENDRLIITTSSLLKGLKVGRKELVLCIEPAEILGMVKVGERIFFDDGKFEARVGTVGSSSIEVTIVRISTRKPELKVEKGVNLPDSDLVIPALTPEDIQNIPFICQHADMVGYSFVSLPSDVDQLRAELQKYGDQNRPAIILKIERLPAVQNLPALLLNGMHDRAFGVMIARGDLAVEIGFERLSEIQEEILWICEAAHVPVIWATQILETMNKTGFATRSEITDAAMGVMAECVMLNKGKFLTKTIRTLDNILLRQLGHFDKKRYIMRPLGIASNFLQSRK